MSQKRCFEIRQVYKNVWLFEFTDRYDMAMHFCRFQEFYESPNEEFRGRRFDLLDFMEWYSKEYGEGIFTYPDDWCGFNVPAKVIHDCYAMHNSGRMYHGNHCDLNRYDEAIRNAMGEKGIYGDDDYVIGAMKGDNVTINHETAHGIYHSSQGYRFEMNRITKTMSPEDREAFDTYLRDTGYTEKVFLDEIQAYSSTELPTCLEKREGLKALVPQYEEVLQKYLKRLSE